MKEQMVDLLSTPALVITILGAVGLAIPVIDALKRERGSNNKLYSGIAFGALIIVIGIIIFRILSGEVMPTVAFSKGLLADDMFGSFFAISLLIVSIMVTASSWNYMKGRANPAAYYSLILLSTIGMVIIGYSTDLLMLLVAWELMSLPTYALAAFSKRDPISNEAAIKYFMFGALSTAILVFAIGLVYGVTGTTNIGAAIQTMANLQVDVIPIGILAIALFIAGFGFKMGLVPFHMWLPDAYEGSPTTIGALLAAGTKKAGFAAGLRVVVLGIFALNADWTMTLAILAVFTMTLGNFGALIQKSVPRILAYSSIAQAGYILMGLALAPYSEQALSGSLFHILNHAVMKSAGFIAAAAIVAWGPYLAIAAVLNSALSLGYYAWIIRKMYMEDATDMSKIKEPTAIVAVLIFAIIFMVGFGIWHAPLLDFASQALPNLQSVASIAPKTS